MLSFLVFHNDAERQPGHAFARVTLRRVAGLVRGTRGLWLGGHEIFELHVARVVARVLPASLTAAGAAFAVTLPFGRGDIGLLSVVVETILAVIVGVLVYGGATMMLRVKEVDEVLGSMRARFRR